MPTPLLKVEDLHTYFFTSGGTVRAVDGVNLEIAPGETVGLVGESGCGKTMTAMSLMRLVPQPPGRIVQGRVWFDGRDLLRLSPSEMRSVRGRDIAMVFQDPITYLNPVLKVGHQVGEVLARHLGLEAREVKRRVRDLLTKVQIPDPERVADSYPHQLSGGMCQRILIATALCCNPRLLIADEPTTALDVTVQAQILELLKELSRESGTSLLLITHDMGIVAEICDRVYVMYAGKVAESADVLTLFDAPKHPYTIGLLGSVLSINEYRPELVVLEGTVPSLITPPPGCRFFERCGKAMEMCRSEEPPWTQLGPALGVACWLYGPR
jgi:oligopeptide/dipeptide ABC transporter ATP-binding protein